MLSGSGVPAELLLIIGSPFTKTLESRPMEKSVPLILVASPAVRLIVLLPMTASMPERDVVTVGNPVPVAPLPLGLPGLEVWCGVVADGPEALLVLAGRAVELLLCEP